MPLCDEHTAYYFDSGGWWVGAGWTEDTMWAGWTEDAMWAPVWLVSCSMP